MVTPILAQLGEPDAPAHPEPDRADLALPRLYRIELALLAAHLQLRSLHGGIADFLCAHGRRPSECFTVTTESAEALLRLDAIRSDVQAVRRLLARGSDL